MTVKYPKTVGQCIDSMYAMREQRLNLQKQVELMKKEEAAIEAHILNQFSKAEIRGAKGTTATGSVTAKTVYSIADWPTFIGWVAKHKAWDILYKQAGQTALRERFDNGQEVPGIEAFEKIGLSLTKAGGA